MASLGHIAVGMAAARRHDDGRRPGWRSMAIWSAVSMLPDADVIGFGMGVAYGDPWGHRGATHSFAFSIALGVAIGLVASRLRLPAVRTGLIASLVLASHALLDTLTNGGLGCALLWPFDRTRYFAPWNPIPVSPIGLAYLSPYGLMVSLVEIVLFSPVFFVALRPTASGFWTKRTTAGLLAVWLVAAWLIASSDPLREKVIGLILREDTEFASGFSEGAFRTLERGQSETDVRRTLGSPLRQFWFYGSSGKSAFEIAAAAVAPGCLSVGFRGNVVWWTHVPDLCRKLGIDGGTPMADVVRLLGTPSDACWQYGWSPGGRYHRLRDVCFFNGSVVELFRRWSRDQS